VSCDGSRQSLDSLNQFLVTLSVLHERRANGGPYIEKCEHCFALPGKERFKGCIADPGNPVPYRRGNPRKSTDVRSAQRKATGRGLKTSRGDSTITPMELCRIRNVLLSSNSLHNLQIWVTILSATKLVLRAGELLRLKFDKSWIPPETTAEVEDDDDDDDDNDDDDGIEERAAGGECLDIVSGEATEILSNNSTAQKSKQKRSRSKKTINTQTQEKRDNDLQKFNYIVWELSQVDHRTNEVKLLVF
jgi:hypothetical protein